MELRLYLEKPLETARGKKQSQVKTKKQKF